MPRIGRQIPHFEWIDKNSIHAVFSNDRIYRYRLSMEYNKALLDKEKDKSLAVILKNPSAADEANADATIRKVETFVYHRFEDVKYLHILNIFAFRATDPADLNEAFQSKGAMQVIGPENDHIIRSTFAECDYIILAWGNRSGIDKTLYEERVYRVIQLLNEIPGQKLFSVSGPNKTIQPLHGLMWGYDYKLGPANDYLEQT